MDGNPGKLPPEIKTFLLEHKKFQFLGTKSQAKKERDEHSLVSTFLLREGNLWAVETGTHIPGRM